MDHHKKLKAKWDMEHLRTALQDRNQAAIILEQLISDYAVPSYVKSYTVDVDEHLARVLLEFYNWSYNRTLSQITVKKYSAAMLRGHFLDTGEALIFSTFEGRGLDLQHRLHAIIDAAQTKSDITVRLTVTLGIEAADHEAFVRLFTVAQGAKARTDRNTVRGMTQTHGSKANIYDQAIFNVMKWVMLPKTTEAGNIDAAIDKLDVYEQMRDHKQQYSSAFDYVSKLYAAYIAPYLTTKGKIDVGNIKYDLTKQRLPFYTAAYMLMARMNAASATLYIESWFDVSNTLPKGNPVDALRGMFLERFGTGMRDKLRPVHVRHAMLTAYEHMVNGTTRPVWYPADFGLVGLGQDSAAPVVATAGA